MRRLAPAWRAALLVSAAMMVLVAPAAAQPRGLVLQAQPSPLLPVPPAPPRRAPAPAQRSFEPAPTPNRDVDAPSGPRASATPQVSPGLFTRSDQYRGEGYSQGSTAQSEQEKRVRPGAGLKLRLPLQPD